MLKKSSTLFLKPTNFYRYFLSFIFKGPRSGGRHRRRRCRHGQIHRWPAGARVRRGQVGGLCRVFGEYSVALETKIFKEKKHFFSQKHYANFVVVVLH